MQTNIPIDQVKQIGVGLAFIVFPLLFIFAFATHQGLLSPQLLNPQQLIERAHHADLLHLGHVLVLLCTGLLVVAALHFMSLLDRTPWASAGFVGAVLAILGAIFLAADKGALCLTMSAFDTLSESEFTQALPAILSLFTRQGYLVLLWGILLLPIGFALQAIALIATHSLALWQGLLFLVGVLLIGTPDGLEIVNLSAALMMAVAFLPYGFQLIAAALP